MLQGRRLRQANFPSTPGPNIMYASHYRRHTYQHIPGRHRRRRININMLDTTTYARTQTSTSQNYRSSYFPSCLLLLMTSPSTITTIHWSNHLPLLAAPVLSYCQGLRPLLTMMTPQCRHHCRRWSYHKGVDCSDKKNAPPPKKKDMSNKEFKKNKQTRNQKIIIDYYE